MSVAKVIQLFLKCLFSGQVLQLMMLPGRILRIFVPVSHMHRHGGKPVFKEGGTSATRREARRTMKLTGVDPRRRQMVLKRRTR